MYRSFNKCLIFYKKRRKLICTPKYVNINDAKINDKLIVLNLYIFFDIFK